MHCPKCHYEPTLAEQQSSPGDCVRCGVNYEGHARYVAENAARKLLSFLKGLTEGRAVAAESGILSEAEPIAPYHMYRRMCEEATK